jgi:hypothetical protein
MDSHFERQDQTVPKQGIQEITAQEDA